MNKYRRSCNSVPNDKILYWTKLKVFAGAKMNAIEKLKCVLGWVENILGKGENAGFQYFLFLPQLFLNASFSGYFMVKC